MRKHRLNSPISAKNELDLHVEQLYSEGHRSYDDLDEHDIEILTSMIMHQCNRSGRFEFISETDVADEVANRLAHLLLDPQPEEAKELIEVMKSGAKKMAEKRINELLNLEATFENYRHPIHQPSEEDLLLAAHQREVAQEMNGGLYA